MRYLNKHGNILIILVVIFALGLAGAVYYWLKKDQITPQTSQNTNQTAENEETKKPELPFIDLQPTVDAWAAKQSGSASVVIIDLANNKTAASLNPDKAYFTASIYKLYVAYIGYQKVADGTYSLNDSYLLGYTRGKCLDEMIRSSYSPCGEEMMKELGKRNIDSQIKNYGVENTSLMGLYTSAADAAIILQRLHEKRELTDEHTNLFLDSMKTQPAKYRSGLPSGFTRSTVYNKVGWNLDLEWHDTAIITLPSGRSYVISVLTRSVGRANIVNLAKAIEAKLLN